MPTATAKEEKMIGKPELLEMLRDARKGNGVLYKNTALDKAIVEIEHLSRPVYGEILERLQRIEALIERLARQLGLGKL